jgi:hypothetical protein
MSAMQHRKLVLNLRWCGWRPAGVSPLWVYCYGFGIWCGRLLFGVGYDTRNSTIEQEF